MYTTKPARNVPLCCAHSACCAAASAVCFKIEKDVGEEGSVVHELLWEVIF